MCLIIHSPKGTDIDTWILESAAEYNADGIGIMHDGRVERHVKLSINALRKKLDKLIDTEYAIHFRMATDGKINKSNVHPFRTHARGYLMHNGILTKYRTSKGSDKSDTRRFVEEYLNPLMKSSGGTLPRAAIEQESAGNALLHMSRSGLFTFFGSSWVEHYGLKFSNEYAWDSPGQYPVWTGTDLPVDMDRKYVGGSLSWEILSALVSVSDVLPINDVSFIAYEDIDLQDRVLSEELSVDTFLERASDETLLMLYTWAANHQYLVA